MWEYFRKILVLPHAASSLRAMHRVGLLDLLFKEFQAIDSLVIRDYYHRYTVDEHSLVTIENLHSLVVQKRRPGPPLPRHSFLAGAPGTALFVAAVSRRRQGHAQREPRGRQPGSGQGVFERLHFDTFGRETVTFLIANHLRMSATLLRRDIFDPEAVHDFAKTVGTIEHLKMLTLFTYADIKAVNPEALTPWKAEMLWQLYAATENYLNRSVDDQRMYLAGEDAQQLERLIPNGRGCGGSGSIQKFPRWLSPAVLADSFVRGNFRSLPDVPAARTFRGGNQHHQARPILRTGSGHQGSSLSFHESGRDDLFVGHEYSEGRRLRQSKRNRSGRAAFFRPLSNARSQSVGNPPAEAATGRRDLRASWTSPP